MRIGFLECKTNTKDGFPAFSALADKQANVQTVRLTAPNPFKVPAACRKLFAQGAECIIAFVTTESDNEAELGFLRDKVADVEVLESKYVFLVLEDIHVRDDQLTDSLGRALSQALEHLPAPSTASTEPSGSMDMFGTVSEPAASSARPHEEEDVHEFMDESKHKLF